MITKIISNFFILIKTLFPIKLSLKMKNQSYNKNKHHFKKIWK